MPTILGNVTQEVYDRLSVEYMETIGPKDSAQYYNFFASVQRQVEKALTSKFESMGVKMIRRLQEENNPNRPAMRFDLVFKDDPTSTALLSKKLNLTQIMKEVLLVDPKISTVVPDVKIVNPQYLTEKVDEVTDLTIAKFQALFRERTRELEEKLTKEGLLYDTEPTNHALVGNKQGHKGQ